MEGTVIKINKAASKIFTILGDDGIEYFGHLHELADKKQFKHYFYKGSKCKFDVIDEGKAHLKAVHIESIDVYDPLAEVRKQRTLESKERHEINIIKKEEKKAVENGKMDIKNMRHSDPGFEQHMNQMKRHERNLQWDQYIKDHMKYVIQVQKDSQWINVKPLELFDDPNAAKDMVKYHKQTTGGRFRLRKCTIHIIGGKYLVKEL